MSVHVETHVKTEQFTSKELARKNIQLTGRGDMFTLMPEAMPGAMPEDPNLRLKKIPSFIKMNSGRRFYGYYDFDTNVFSCISKDVYTNYTKRVREVSRFYSECQEAIYLISFVNESFIETFDYDNSQYTNAFGEGYEMRSLGKCIEQHGSCSLAVTSNAGNLC